MANALNSILRYVYVAEAEKRFSGQYWLLSQRYFGLSTILCRRTVIVSATGNKQVDLFEPAFFSICIDILV